MTVFEFSDFREFMKYRLSSELYSVGGHKKSNLSRVAKNLGYASPSVLSMVINGKRAPSEEFCDALVQSWNLSLKEREYFRLLVQLDRKKKLGHDTTDTVEQIRRMVGNKAIKVFKDSEFSLIREWHYNVIQLLVESPSFREDPIWISRILRRKITPSQAQQALDRMEQAGILVRDSETGRLVVSATHTETAQDVPSSAVQLHHKEMIHRGLEALDERAQAERFINSLAFHLDRERLPEIRERLLDFMRGINTEFAAKPTDSVYQLNIQFFEHTIENKSLNMGSSNEVH